MKQTDGPSASFRQRRIKNSRRLIRATLSVLLGDAVEADIITSNPVIGLARKGRKQAGTLSQADRQHSIRPMTYEQLAKFLKVANQLATTAQRNGEGLSKRRNAVLFRTLAETALRPSEALRLTWADIDTTRRTVDVDATKTDNRRTIPLTIPLIQALESWRGSWRALHARARLAGGRGSEWVFPSRTGKLLNAKPMGRELLAVLRRAGLPKFKLYDLRHTFATQLLEQLVQITAVAGLLGHKKLTTTVMYYAHWLPSESDARYLDRLSAARQAAGDLNGDFVRTSKKDRPEILGKMVSRGGIEPPTP